MGAQQQLMLAATTPPAVTGQVVFDTVGTYNWMCPPGVTSVSVVVVGCGSSSGGALAYKNNIAVVPGQTYLVYVTAAGTSYFVSTSLCSAGQGTTRVGDGGGNGGAGYGGGAGGYSGNGGVSGGAAPSGGAGGAGGKHDWSWDDGAGYSASGQMTGAGGGVGLLGEGASGVNGPRTYSDNSDTPAAGGTGGSGGGAGPATASGAANANMVGGSYGGGRGHWELEDSSGYSNQANGSSSKSAIRIIWPGDQRQFPSTRTADE